MDTWGKKIHPFRGMTLIQISHIFLGFIHISMWDSHKRKSASCSLFRSLEKKNYFLPQKIPWWISSASWHLFQVERCPPNLSLHFCKAQLFLFLQQKQRQGHAEIWDECAQLSKVCHLQQESREQPEAPSDCENAALQHSKSKKIFKNCSISNIKVPWDFARFLYCYYQPKFQVLHTEWWFLPAQCYCTARWFVFFSVQSDCKEPSADADL